MEFLRESLLFLPFSSVSCCVSSPRSPRVSFYLETTKTFLSPQYNCRLQTSANMAGGWELRGFHRMGTRVAWGMAAYVSITQVSRLWRWKAEGLPPSTTGNLGGEGRGSARGGGGRGSNGASGGGGGSGSSGGRSGGAGNRDDELLRSYAPIAAFNASLVRNEDSYEKIATHSFTGMRFKSFDHDLLSSAVASLRFASGRIADTLEHERPSYFRATPNHSVELRAADVLRKLIVFPRVCFAKVDLLDEESGDGAADGAGGKVATRSSGNATAKVRTLLDAAAATALHVAQKCSYVPAIRDALLGRSGENTGLVMTAALPLLRFHSSSSASPSSPSSKPSSFYSSKFMATSVIVLNRALYLRGYGPGAAAAHSPAAAAALSDSNALGEDGVKKVAEIIAARVRHVTLGLTGDASATAATAAAAAVGNEDDDDHPGETDLRVPDASSGVEVAKVRLGAGGGIDLDVRFEKGANGVRSSSGSGGNSNSNSGGAKSALLLEASELTRLVHRLVEAEEAAAAALHGGAALASGAISSSSSSSSSIAGASAEERSRALCLRAELTRLGVPAMLRSLSAAMFRVNAQVGVQYCFSRVCIALDESKATDAHSEPTTMDQTEHTIT